MTKCEEYMGSSITAQSPLPIVCEANQSSTTTLPQTNSSININKILPDSLLVEIPQRLPCHYACQAKSVCKLWYTLLSDPYFFRSFIRYHGQYSCASCSFLPFTLLYEFNYWHLRLTLNVHNQIHAILQHPIFESHGFHLEFLPCFKPWEPNPIWVVASHKDLLVCCDSKMSLQSIYYICNPLTKQCISLPPVRGCHRVADTAIGFISSDTDSFNNRYNLVKVPELDSHPGNNRLRVEVFCSDTGVWSEYTVSSPLRSFKRTWQFKPDAITFRNKLHWLINVETIVVFDPYEDSYQCGAFDLPLELNPEVGICFGACGEHLKVSQITGVCQNRVLVVWKLRDYVTCNWQLEYTVNLTEMSFVDGQGLIGFRHSSMEVLAFHPNNDEVLYLRLDNKIVLCDPKRRRLEVVSECLEDSFFSVGTRGVFLLEHPCWPSWISPFSNSGNITH